LGKNRPLIFWRNCLDKMRRQWILFPHLLKEDQE
jgi:hypothetical protein